MEPFMKRTIFFFVKVCEKKKYTHDLLDGKLYMNRLSYFKKIEVEDEANRKDQHEGVIGWLQPGKGQLELNGYQIPKEDLAGPISIQMNYFDNFNIFCVYAAHSGDFQKLNQQSLPEFRRQLQIPDSCLNLGKYAVVIRNVTEFQLRVKKAAQDNKYTGSFKLVDYYNPEKFSGFFTENDAVFKKRKEFQHQREYRFSLNTGTSDNKAIILEIGDIRDIAEVCNSNEVNDSLEIKLPN